jgi:catechol 1,2-dioxygenase
MRGVYRTDGDGRYFVRTTRPKWYPVPTDGPVGDMLRATDRHPYRPGHVHFMISAPGYQPLVTHIFDKSGEYLDSDTVFAVKDSLKVDFRDQSTQEDLGRRAGVQPPYAIAEYDFVLNPA